MMQGNVGDHADDNGAFHDGGLILTFPDRTVGIFLAFQTQRIPTDGTGKPTADARPLSSVIGHVVPPTPVASEVYLERALINPAGPDAGREVLVLGNCATAARSLTGWRLVDRNGRTTVLDVEIGDDRTRFADARALNVYAGCAPITRASGRSLSITHRHIKNNRLATVGWMWAFAATANFPTARDRYRRRRLHGDRHAAANRHLCNKLLGQLHHCLQHRQTFDEARAFPGAALHRCGLGDSPPSDTAALDLSLASETRTGTA